MSSSRSCPAARASSSETRAVPYRCSPKTSACSRKRPASTMRKNSSRVVKWYSRPSSSDPRGWRVVHETAKSTPLTCLRSSLTSVLLPEPEGAEMMKRIPANVQASFSFQYRVCVVYRSILEDPAEAKARVFCDLCGTAKVLLFHKTLHDAGSLFSVLSSLFCVLCSV